MAEILNEYVDFKYLVKEGNLPLKDNLEGQDKLLIERLKNAIFCFLEVHGEKVGDVAGDYYLWINKVSLLRR